ncbi:hypothetical protein HMPREF2738_01900 [Clostridiales bacterium KLE1615]|nr:hypothetical protein HMPREF2738_01900 [Clostridiales bacterium KLE1615]
MIFRKKILYFDFITIFLYFFLSKTKEPVDEKTFSLPLAICCLYSKTPI